jgi:hypothetical protein
VRRGRAAAVSAPRSERRVELDELSKRWRAAFEAAEGALAAATTSLPPGELRDRSARLLNERSATVELLDAVAKERGERTRFSHLLSSRLSLNGCSVSRRP